MKRVKRAAHTLLLAVMLCMLLATAVFAATEGSVWLDLSTEEGTGARIVTDTAVTDGVIQLTYDSGALTYEGVELDEAYVAMYAVNTDEDGLVKISWVAPEAYTVSGDEAELIRVNFSGTAEAGSITLSGTVTDADGNEIQVASGDSSDTGEEATIIIAIAAAVVCVVGVVVLLVVNKRRDAK